MNGLSKLQARLLPLRGQHASVDAFLAQLSLRPLPAPYLEPLSLLACQSFLLQQESMQNSKERRRIEQDLCLVELLKDHRRSADRRPTQIGRASCRERV